MSGHYVKDYVVIGEEMQTFFENKYYNHKKPIQEYISDERVKMVFGCTTKEENLFR